MTWIATLSGARVDYLHPDPSTIHLEDIAHALAGINRFTGHTAGRYSVAQHCVYASHTVPSRFAKVALMHDAAEAYMQDLSQPLKVAMRLIHKDNNGKTAYDILENRMHQAVAERFGVDYPFPSPVKIADLRLLATEAEDLGFGTLNWDLPEPRYPDLRIIPWSDVCAEREFLAAARSLGVE